MGVITTTLPLELNQARKFEILITMRHICISVMALSTFIIAFSSDGMASKSSSKGRENCVFNPHNPTHCPECMDRCETKLIEVAKKCKMSRWNRNHRCVNKFLGKYAKDCFECTGYICFGLKVNLPQC